jgi:hypothetical protein
MTNSAQPWPYSHGWPLWPFTKLSETDMRRLLEKLHEQRWDEIEEALL